MFQTSSHSRHPVMSALAGDDMHVWSHVSLIANRPWFCATYEAPTPHGLITDTVLLSSIDQVTALLEKNGSDITVRQLMLVSPDYLNKSNQWRMEPLNEIWDCRSEAESAPTYAYVLADGRRYYDFFHFVEPSDRGGVTMKACVASLNRRRA